MGHSVRASEQGLAIADRARQRRGWTKTSTARWWQDAHTSRATLRRFWRGERIQQAAFIAICQAVGLQDWQAIAEQPVDSFSGSTDSTVGPSSTAAIPDTLEQSASPPDSIDWGDAPDVEQFYGRQRELQQLQGWVQANAKLINISGLGGSGKTALAVVLAEQHQSEFEWVIWRSVHAQPTIEARLTDLLDAPIETVDQGVRQLLKRMQSRWLIILDGWNDYEDREGETDRSNPHLDLLYRLAQARHRSCVLVTSRQLLPVQFQTLNRFQSLPLGGLSVGAAVQLLQDCGCDGLPSQLDALAQRCSYNPLALKIAASTIQSVFGGQITPFLSQDTSVLSAAIRPLVQQQFSGLNVLEKTLLFWLAIWQEPIAVCRLQTHLFDSSGAAAVIAALAALVQRALITRHFLSDEPSFSLSPLIRAFVIETFVKKILHEILQAQQQQSIQPCDRLKTHCLLRPGTDDILGDSILMAVQAAYRRHLPTSSAWLDRLLQQAKNEAPETIGYLVFNLTVLKTAVERAVEP